MDNCDNSPLELIIQNGNAESFFSFIQTQPIEFYTKPLTDDGKNILHEIAFLDLENFYLLLLKQLKAICLKEQLNQIINSRDSNDNIALFYGVFRGNMLIVKSLIANGSEVKASNVNKKGVLHFAAQGDQSAMLIYFKDKYKHSIYQKDSEGSTPLHYCCIHGSLKAISFMLSWMHHIDIPNNKGETPLYLALFTERTHIIRKLLFKGADPYSKLFEGKSILDIAKGHFQLRSIYEMIIEVNQTTKCFNSIKKDVIYSPTSFCLLLSVNAFLNTLILLPSINSYYLTLMYYFLVLSLIVIFSFISMSDSGIISDNRHMPWLDLVELNVNVNAMCPYCKVRKEMKSKHCHICNHCVEDFDHHCNWINNCVGAGNNNGFIAFLIDIISNLAYGYYIGYTFYHIDTTASSVSTKYTIRLIISVTLMSVYILLFIPVAFILFTQLKKKLKGKGINHEIW